MFASKLTDTVDILCVSGVINIYMHTCTCTCTLAPTSMHAHDGYAFRIGTPMWLIIAVELKRAVAHLLL